MLSKGHRGMLLVVWWWDLLLFFSDFSLAAQDYYPRVALSTVAWVLLNRLAIKKMPLHTCPQANLMGPISKLRFPFSGVSS